METFSNNLENKKSYLLVRFWCILNRTQSLPFIFKFLIELSEFVYSKAGLFTNCAGAFFHSFLTSLTSWALGKSCIPPNLMMIENSGIIIYFIDPLSVQSRILRVLFSSKEKNQSIWNQSIWHSEL